MTVIPFFISDQLIDDTLCTALEGGITSWADNAEPDHWPEGITYTSDALTKGADVLITDDEGTVHRLTVTKMRKGIRAYCKAAHTTPAKIDDDPVDASGADAIVQYALFGEVVYG